MKAAIYSTAIQQGALWTKQFTYKSGATEATATPVNLTGYNARMKIKDASGALVLSLSTTPTANGDVITLGGAAGTVTVTIKTATTTAFDFSTATYDLELVQPDSEVIRLVQGDLTLEREVTT
jgi:hypothetical protein